MSQTTCANGLRAVGATLLLLGFTSASLAQDFDGQSVGVGETVLVPELRIDYLANDNLFLTAADETEGSAVVVSPAVRWTADRRLLTLNATYLGAYALYDEDALDYAEHALRLDADAEFGARRRARGALSVERDSEEFGLDLTRGIAGADTEPVVSDTVEARGSFGYGAEGARGNLEGGVRIAGVVYANREDLTDGLDYAVIEPYGQFSLRLGGRLRGLVETRFALFDYDDEARNRRETSLFGGLSLAATGRSGGSLKLGASRADRDEVAVEDETAFVAEIDLYYRPANFSRFDLVFERKFDDRGRDSAGRRTQGITDRFTLLWRHDWSSRVFHRASLSRRADLRDCPASDSATVGAAFELNLKLRRWLEIGAGVVATERSSTDCDGVASDSDRLDFTRTIVGGHVRATL